VLSQIGSVGWTRSGLIVVLGVWMLFRTLMTIAGMPSTIAGRAIRRLGGTALAPRFEPDSVDARASTAT
jgi:hypothetical protein